MKAYKGFGKDLKCRGFSMRSEGIPRKKGKKRELSNAVSMPVIPGHI